MTFNIYPNFGQPSAPQHPEQDTAHYIYTEDYELPPSYQHVEREKQKNRIIRFFNSVKSGCWIVLKFIGHCAREIFIRASAELLVKFVMLFIDMFRESQADKQKKEEEKKKNNKKTTEDGVRKRADFGEGVDQ